MKIYDISRELFSTPVYSGDPSAKLEKISNMSLGDNYNLSVLTACVHGATHIDAPLHFFDGGEDVTEVPLEHCVGKCVVISFSGVLLGNKAEEIMEKISAKRILFKGDVNISESAAFVFGTAGIVLIGTENQSVAAAETTAAVHRDLLINKIVLLEGIDLSLVNPGTYFLFAAPLKLSGAEGSPVRALLIENQDIEYVPIV